MDVEFRWKMWSIEILTISIKRRYVGNNVPLGGTIHQRAEISRTIRGQQIVFRTRPGSQPSPRTTTVFYSVSESSLRLVRSRRYPIFFFFFSATINHPLSSLFRAVCSWFAESTRWLSHSLAAFQIERNRYSIERHLSDVFVSEDDEWVVKKEERRKRRSKKEGPR